MKPLCVLLLLIAINLPGSAQVDPTAYAAADPIGTFSLPRLDVTLHRGMTTTDVQTALAGLNLALTDDGDGVATQWLSGVTFIGEDPLAIQVLLAGDTLTGVIVTSKTTYHRDWMENLATRLPAAGTRRVYTVYPTEEIFTRATPQVFLEATRQDTTFAEGPVTLYHYQIDFLTPEEGQIWADPPATPISLPGQSAALRGGMTLSEIQTALSPAEITFSTSRGELNTLALYETYLSAGDLVYPLVICLVNDRLWRIAIPSTQETSVLSDWMNGLLAALPESTQRVENFSDITPDSESWISENEIYTYGRQREEGVDSVIHVYAIDFLGF